MLFNYIWASLKIVVHLDIVQCMVHVDLLIIGAGPIGLSCGIAAQNAAIGYKIIDKGCLVNSIHNFPSDMTFFSSSDKLEIGGIPFTSLAVRPSKQEGLEYYRRVAEHYDLNIGLYEVFESVEQVDKEASFARSRFKVVTSKETYTCNFMVNATGFYDTPIRINIPGEDLEKVKHYFTSAHHLFKQKVTIIGASNSAVDVALEAHRKGAEVTLLIRKNEIGDNVKYWIKPDLDARIAEGSITAYFESQVLEVTDTHIRFLHKGKPMQIENDFVYAMTGYQPNMDLSEKLGITFDPSTRYPNYTVETMETNISGIYLAGVLSGGLNTRKQFIENSRDHGYKIISHIKQLLE